MCGYCGRDSAKFKITLAGMALSTKSKGLDMFKDMRRKDRQISADEAMEVLTAKIIDKPDGQ